MDQERITTRHMARMDNRQEEQHLPNTDNTTNGLINMDNQQMENQPRATASWSIGDTNQGANVTDLQQTTTPAMKKWKKRMSAVGNTRPISITTAPVSANNRGRVYRCLRCDASPYEGEKGKVVKHFYRKHIALDSVPYYCNICKFVTTTQGELEKHMDVKIYPTHAATVNAMLASGQSVGENESLLQNTRFHVINECDMKRLDKETSSTIYESRKSKLSNSSSIQTTNDILRTVMMSSNIPVIERSIRTPSPACTENILPSLLGIQLSPAPFTITKEMSRGKLAPMKKNTTPSSSTSTSSTYSESSSSSSKSSLRKEVGELRKATETMATAMESLIMEVNGMRKELTKLNEEKERRDKDHGKENDRRATEDRRAMEDRRAAEDRRATEDRRAAEDRRATEDNRRAMENRNHQPSRDRYHPYGRMHYRV